MQHDALSGGCEAFGAPAVERLAGVFVVDHQVVMSLGSLLVHVTHRQQGAPAVTATPAADCRSCSVVDTMMVVRLLH